MAVFQQKGSHRNAVVVSAVRLITQRASAQPTAVGTVLQKRSSVVVDATYKRGSIKVSKRYCLPNGVYGLVIACKNIPTSYPIAQDIKQALCLTHPLAVSLYHFWSTQGLGVHSEVLRPMTAFLVTFGSSVA